MITSPKTQNAILVVTIILTIASGIGLYHNASYYGGSFAIIKYLDISLEKVALTNYDSENKTLNPRLHLFFRFVAPEVVIGDATLSSLTAKVYLNNESIKYVHFRLLIPSEYRKITSSYNNSFTISGTITEMEDKMLLYNATALNNWVFTVRLTIFYHLFQSRSESVDIQFFTYEGVEITPPS